MRRTVVALGFGLVLLACGEADGPVQSSVGPSPLLSMDPDRLWVLLQAARINPRCGRYYAEPSDPRVAGLRTKCEISERNTLDWLHANGVADARAEHLRAPAFWAWYGDRQSQINACRSRVEPGSRSFWEERNTCDPYERITRLEKKTLQAAGFVRPGS